MAKERKEYFYNPIDFEDDIAVGIKLPFSEPITLDLKQKLEEGITEDINFWLPYIIIDKVNVSPEEDRNYVGISLNFRVTEQGANRQIILYVDSAGSATIE